MPICKGSSVSLRAMMVLLLFSAIQLFLAGSAACQTNGENPGSNTFFPLGIYHVNPEDYRKVKEAGFNVVQAFISEESLKAAQKNDLFLLGVLYPGMKLKHDYLLDKISKFKNERRILAWYLFDEPDIWKVEPEEIKNACDVLRGIDNLRPIYLTVSPKGDIGDYIKSIDILGVDRYPVPEDDLAAVYDSVKSAKSAAGHDKRVWAIIQAFKKPKRRPPTPVELRAMAYMSVIGGADGVLYYAYSDPGWKLSDNMQLWDEIKNVNSELSSLSGLLLFGKDITSEAHSDSAGLKLRYLEFRSNRMLLAVNSNDIPAKTKIKFKKGLVKEVEDILGKRVLKVSGDAIEDTFAGYAVKVYTVR